MRPHVSTAVKPGICLTARKGALLVSTSAKPGSARRREKESVWRAPRPVHCCKAEVHCCTLCGSFSCTLLTERPNGTKESFACINCCKQGSADLPLYLFNVSKIEFGDRVQML
eukprot:GEMP01042461.1.p1 GENE.GEMP01042461.1~~GEMP01042461.1.p1  ORF type:complete len:113 (+),score=2.73 GEMP01042461.1:1018-1356(+)